MKPLLLFLAITVSGITLQAAELRFTVNLPHPSATLKIDGTDRGSDGTPSRLFVWSGDLAPGTYSYEIVVTYREIAVAKRVYVGTDRQGEITFSAREFAGVPMAALLASIQRSRSHFTPIGEEQVQAARTDLLNQLATLDAWVSSQTDPETWRIYLRWADIHAQLRSNSPDHDVMSAVLSRYFGSERGLERVEFLRVRLSLEHYRDTLVFSRQQDLGKIYLSHLDTLATHLATYESHPTPETNYQIGRSLGWLQRAGQATELVRAIHERFSKPNFLLSLSHRFLAPQFVKDVNETAPVREIIRGASVTGISNFQGRTSLRFVPDEDQAILEVVLSGTIATETEASRQRVTVSSTGQTSVDARKRFVVTRDGIRALPATASCVSTSVYNNVHMDALLPLVRRIGVNRAYGEREAADQESARLSERKLRAQLDEVPVTPFDALSQPYYEYIFYPQQRLGVEPEALLWSTTIDQLQHRTLRRTVDHLAAPNSAPQFSTDLDLVLTVHETEVSNLLNPQFAGKELTDQMISDFLKLVFGRTPREFRLGTHLDPWKTMLERSRPFEAAFGHNQARLTLRLQSAEINGIKQEIPVKISGHYDLFATRFGPEGRRLGEIEILPTSHRVVTPELERFLRRKFNDVFLPEIHVDGLTPPQGGPFAMLNQLEMREFRSEQGWILFGWQLSTPPTNGVQ